MNTSYDLHGKKRCITSLKLTLSALASVLALILCPALAFTQASLPPSLTTITNPTPVQNDLFGESVAAMGSDRVLVGGEGAAQAYLFNLNGTLLTTFTNPTTTGDGFGYSLAASGSDRVLIGAYSFAVGALETGRAYLFLTNSALLTTFTNPATATVQSFGWSVAALGNDRVLISGLINGNSPPPYPQETFLFRTNGALLLSITNPTPTYNNDFGESIAVVGSDRLLIGAPASNIGAAVSGAAYLFNTNGVLLSTFTNPAPLASASFGISLAAVGKDRVVVGALSHGSGSSGGAAYLFDTNGLLLTTFTNPIPSAGDNFGWAVAAVGSSRVLVGVYQNTTTSFQDGAAFLFSTNGTLLNTFTNPTPEFQDWYGWAVAGVGTDRVVVGGIWDNTGAIHAGSAYLYTLPYPPLKIGRNGSAVSLSWVTPETGLILQEGGPLGPSTVWSDAIGSDSISGFTNVVQQPIGNGITNRFFRLRRP